MSLDDQRWSRRLPAWLRGHPVLADLGLALVIFAIDSIAVLTSAGLDGQPRDSRWELAAVASALLGVVAVALRRRLIHLAVGWTALHTLATVLLPQLLPSTGLAAMVVTYTVASLWPFRPAFAATAMIWLPAVVLVPYTIGAVDPRTGLPISYYAFTNLMAASVSFFVGRTVHNRRAYVAALEDRARTAEANQEALAAQAVAEERRRIARELHDVVAHHVSVMGVLATGSRRMLTRDPAAVDEALGTIEETGRTALREMRRLLTVLRTDSEPAGELAPQPGLAAVTQLVEQVRDAGLPVNLHVEGEPSHLDPGVSLTVFRIVQEALTNALKHAGAATAEVRLRFGTQALEVEVCDTGRGPQLATAAVGHGLLGMRERVMLYGGTLRTGPRPGGGYRLSARIPVEALDGAASRLEASQ